MTLFGEDVQIFQYRNAAAMEAEAARISPDGFTVGTMQLHWIGSPHFYKQGKLLILYLGDNNRVLQALQESLGPSFAGDGLPTMPPPGP